MNRRESIIAFVALGAVAGSIASFAQQQGKVWRVGFLSLYSASEIAQNTAAFLKGLRELGYIEGKNLVVEWRFAEGNFERLPDLAADLVGAAALGATTRLTTLAISHRRFQSAPSVRIRPNASRPAWRDLLCPGTRIA